MSKPSAARAWTQHLPQANGWYWVQDDHHSDADWGPCYLREGKLHVPFLKSEWIIPPTGLWYYKLEKPP